MDLDALSSMLSGFTGLEPRRREFIEKLPTLTENDLTALNQRDSCCPICLTPFLAVLASEEMALVMESPALCVEELGVTRLADTCGHVFCRKDITTWIRQHDTCPTCRQPFITTSARPANGRAAQDSEYGPDEDEVLRGMTFPDTEEGRGQREMILRVMSLFQGTSSRRSADEVSVRGNEELEFRGGEVLDSINSDRNEFVGMYS